MLDEFGLEQIEESKFDNMKTNDNDYSIDQGEDLAFCDISAIDFKNVNLREKSSRAMDQSIMNQSELEIFDMFKIGKGS